jgi:lipoate-protein ligase A
VIDKPYHRPAAELAADELLLELAQEAFAESAGPPWLRFWESPTYFVTLGYTNSAAREVHVEACRAQGVPILRRCSGGGTVLQGPGCLNFALLHPIAPGEEFNVSGTNCLVMRRHRALFSTLLGEEVALEGYTDLAVGGLKFSGNAQRRKSRAFLFHGTLLLDFDLAKIQELLAPPSLEPAYRAGRPHEGFLRNLHLPAGQVAEALKATWNATPAPQLPPARLHALIAARYESDDWNFKF